MNTEERTRQLKATLDVARRRQRTNRRSEPPRVGDTFLSRRTADYPVEWLVLNDNGGKRCQVAPLDVHPYAGSRDVKRSAPDATGVVRCDLDTWLDATELETELRTGTLTSAEMDEVRRRRQAIAEQTLAATLREEEVDTDPEYCLWRDETLRPALDALGRTDESNVVVFPDRWRRWRPLIAAAALLALAVPLAWQFEQLKASEKAMVELKNDFAERLEGIFDDRVVVNLPSFVLGGEARRRASQGFPEVIDPGDASRFTLSLEVTDPEPYFRYRLRLLKNEGEGVREVWSNDQMVTFNGKWLRLDLLTDLLDPESEYELQVDGLNAGGATPLKERYRIQLNR